MGKEKLIPIFAMVVLLTGIFSSAYVYATQVNTDTIKIADETYTIDQIFLITKSRTIETPDRENFSGVALDDLITKTGVDCLSCHKYKIVGSDNYEKTVTWGNMQNGVLTEEGTAAFSDLAKAFRVKNVVKIEVVE